MVFTKRLRDRVRSGEITCSVRIWQRPHVKVGGRYPMDEGEIEIDSIEPIGFSDITPALARASGFLGVLDLLKVAKHGKGETSTWSASTIYRDRKRLASRLNQFDDWATVRLKKQTKSQKSKKSFEPGSFGDARKFFALSLTNGSSVTRATMARVTS